LLRVNLNAVLPPEILKRLTKSTVQGVGAASDTDSDSDSSDNDGEGKETSASSRSPTKRNTKPSTPRTFRAEQKTAPSAADGGLNSLLSDLHGFTPTSTGKNRNERSLLTDASRTQSKKLDAAKSGKDESETKSETLGMAFMNVSTTVVRKKRNSKNDSSVVDIHGNGNGNDIPSKRKVAVEDVHSDSDSDDDDDPTTQTAMPQTAMFPERNIEANPSAAASVPVSEPSRSRTNLKARVSAPRLAAPGMQRATNTIPAPYSSSSMYNPSADSASASAYPDVSTGQAQHHQDTTSQPQFQTQDPTPIQSQPNKKRSKRELEKALRAGNLDSINLHQYTQNAHSMESINYGAQNHDQLMNSSAEGGRSSYGTGGLEHYVPSEGTSVKGLSGKMKGKHQIHSLVQNAAKLEADQRRMDAMGGGMKRGKSSRADAKRKYGW
jgi:hypothetical protein